jgi:16S rRNA (guanine527-N7)-methyltransferase
MLSQNIELLKKSALEFNITLDQKQIENIETFENQMVEINKVMNLTSIKDPEEIVIKHFVDSLSIFKYVNIFENAKMVDVGTGAGFPGVPLKIIRNNIDMSFLDGTLKKLNFIKDVMNKLEFSNFSILHMRAEEAGRSSDLRELFDFATARAMAELKILAEYCLPLVKIGGTFIAMKGSEVTSEISEAKNAIKILGGEIQSINKFMLPNSDIGRTIVVIRKKYATPMKYPRCSSKVAKEPIR